MKDADKAKAIGEDEKVKDWFRRIKASESAKASYTKGMQYFMEFAREKDLGIGDTPTEFLEYAKKRYRSDALDWKDEIEGVIAEYEDWLSEKPKIFTKGGYEDQDKDMKLAPKTIHTYISGIRSFLNAFNIEVPRSKGRRKPKTLVENNHRLTKEIVRESLKYADVRAKAIILTMLSGGLDDSGILNLKVGDFIRGRGYEPSQIGDLNAWITQEKQKCEDALRNGDLEFGITQLQIRRQKTGIDYYTFISPEGSLAVLDYLAWRNRPSGYSERYKGIGKIREEKRKVRSPEDYLFIKAYIDDWYLPVEVIEKLKPARVEEANSKYKSRATTEIVKEVKEKRNELKLKGYADEVRKLDRSGLMAIFRDLAKKTGISTKIGTYQLLRGHNLRKLFYTLLRNEGVDSFTIEYWMGHTIPDEQAAYFEAIPEKLKGIYAKYMHVLFIGEFETKVLVSKEYAELKEELEGYKEVLKKRNGELKELREELEAMQARDAEREPVDEILSKLISDPEVQKLLRKKLEDLMDG